MGPLEPVGARRRCESNPQPPAADVFRSVKLAVCRSSKEVSQLAQTAAFIYKHK